MRILAIDPGNVSSAFYLVEHGVPTRSGKVRNEETDRRPSARVFEPATLAVEMIASYGMAVGREVFDTWLSVGRFKITLMAHDPANG
jgi:hypothetical protein